MLQPSWKDKPGLCLLLLQNHYLSKSPEHESRGYELAWLEEEDVAAAQFEVAWKKEQVY